MFDKSSYQEFVSRVAEKAIAATEELTVFGQRDEICVATHTIPRIVQACKNAYGRKGEGFFDPVESMVSFAAGGAPGFSDVSSLASKGIEDVTIIAAIKSVVKYLSAERSMTDPSVLISYQQLQAVNTAGGFTAGGTVIGPFIPTPLTTNLKYATSVLTSAAGSAIVLAYGGPIVPGTINLTIAPTVAGAGATILGQDTGGTGVITWSIVTQNASQPAFPTVTVDYVGGNVTISVVTALWTVSGSVTLDVSSDTTGSNILKVKPQFNNLTLAAVPNNVILEDNLESEAYRNRMFQAMIDTGNVLQMGDISFRQLLDFYISYVNLQVVSSTINAGTLALSTNQAGQWIELDLTGYTSSGFTGFAQTKDDRIQQWYLELNTMLLNVSGMGMTALLCGIEGANILDNVAGRFVEDPAFRTMADGYVGTFNNIPVIRHRLVDSVSTTGYANVYAICKDPSGKYAPTVFGEYLPLYTTKQTLNFNNPTQFAQGLFSYIGTNQMILNLISVGRFKFSNYQGT